ncbi:MAG TPA: hypothetical protein VMU30_08950, partial [Bacteroidota bacterium]|nr:hypothetical protein [Bacteroidota bacterium]
MNMISKKGNIIFPFLAELKPNIQTYRSKYAAEFIWLAVGQFLTLLLSFISIKYLTSIGPKDYGLFVLLTSLTSLASSIYFNPFEQSYVRYLFENSSADDQQKMFLRKFLSGIARSVGLTFMLFLCIAAFSHFSSIGKNYVSVAAIVVIVLPLANQPITGMLNALRLRKTVAMIQVTEKAIQVMLFIFISKFVTLTLSLVFQTIGLVFLTSLLLRLYFIRKYCVGIQTPHNARSQLLAPTLPQQLFHFMLPFIIWGIFGGLQMNGERWIVESIMTTSEVGRYGLAFSLISSTAVVSNTIVSQFFLPFIYKAFSSKEESRQQEGKKLIAIYRWSIIVIFVGFACLFGFLGDDVIRLVSTKDFS